MKGRSLDLALGEKVEVEYVEEGELPDDVKLQRAWDLRKTYVVRQIGLTEEDHDLMRRLVAEHKDPEIVRSLSLSTMPLIQRIAEQFPEFSRQIELRQFRPEN